jgi:toxin ParE1/3/4
LTGIDERCQLIARFPYMGEAREDLAPRLRLFTYGSYVIFFQPIDGGIRVIRVLRGSRNFEALFRGDG